MSSPRPARRPILGGLIGALVALAVAVVAWSASSLGESRHVWAVAAAVVIGAVFGSTIDLVRGSICTPGVLPLAIAASALAIYGCVPETDQMVEVGSAVAIVLVIELLGRRTLPVVWHAAAGALVLWAGLYGATGRQSALVGALFACIVVPILGDTLAIVPRFATVREKWRWGVLAVAAACALAMARTGGIAPSSPAGTKTSLRWLAVWFAVTIVVTAGIVLISLRGDQRNADNPL